MGFRKFKGSQLFTGVDFAPGDAVLVTDEEGMVKEIIREADAGEDVQYVEGIVSPGFVNCHCHLELSHLKGIIPPGTGMVPFLVTVMQQRGAAAETIQDAITQSELEMESAGIVAVGDICNTADTLAKKQSRKLFYHNFIEVSGFTEAGAPARFAIAGSIAAQLAETGPASIVPHAPYSVSPALFERIQSSFSGFTLCMHNQESQAENDFFLTGDSELRQLFAMIGVNLDFFVPPRVSSIRAVLHFLPARSPLLLVHNVVTSAEDIRLIKQHNRETFFCLCPNANQYINGTLPPVDLFIKSNCRIVLGTDSLASNYQLSILEEIRTLLFAFPWLDMAQMLKWATSEGAEALGISDRFGTFSPGKKPGVIAINNWKATRLL